MIKNISSNKIGLFEVRMQQKTNNFNSFSTTEIDYLKNLYTKKELYDAMENYIMLVSISCLFISSKYEDIYAIRMKEAEFYIFSKHFKKNQILVMENSILQTLIYDIGFPLPSNCISYYTSIYFQSLGSRFSTRIRFLALTIYKMSLYLEDFSLLKHHERAMVCILTAVHSFDVMAGQSLYPDCDSICERKNKNVLINGDKHVLNNSNIEQTSAFESSIKVLDNEREVRHGPCNYVYIQKVQHEMISNFIACEGVVLKGFKVSQFINTLYSTFKDID